MVLLRQAMERLRDSTARGQLFLGQISTPAVSVFAPRPFPPRPLPIFGFPVFFGGPFFFGGGFNSFWWPSCGPFWGPGCGFSPFYGYGGFGYGSDFENNWPSYG